MGPRASCAVARREEPTANATKRGGGALYQSSLWSDGVLLSFCSLEGCGSVNDPRRLHETPCLCLLHTGPRAALLLVSQL